MLIGSVELFNALGAPVEGAREKRSGIGGRKAGSPGKTSLLHGSPGKTSLLHGMAKRRVLADNSECAVLGVYCSPLLSYHQPRCRLGSLHLRGYLAHKKTRTPRTCTSGLCLGAYGGHRGKGGGSVMQSTPVLASASTQRRLLPRILATSMARGRSTKSSRS